MLGRERRTVHLVREQHLGPMCVHEREAALVRLLNASLQAVVEAGEDELDRVVGHAGLRQEPAQGRPAPDRRTYGLLEPGLADDVGLDEHPAVARALHRHGRLHRRAGAKLVQGERQRRGDEAIDLQPVRGRLDRGDVVVRQEVVEARRRDRVAKRLERHRVVPCGEPELDEADRRLDVAHRPALTSAQIRLRAASPLGVRLRASSRLNVAAGGKTSGFRRTTGARIGASSERLTGEPKYV